MLSENGADVRKKDKKNIYLKLDNQQSFDPSIEDKHHVHILVQMESFEEQHERNLMLPCILPKPKNLYCSSIKHAKNIPEFELASLNCLSFHLQHFSLMLSLSFCRNIHRLDIELLCLYGACPYVPMLEQISFDKH